MTPTQQLFELKLGRPLAEFVTTARDHGDSWRTIARDLHHLTDLVVSDESLRSWYSESIVATGPADERYCAEQS